MIKFVSMMLAVAFAATAYAGPKVFVSDDFKAALGTNGKAVAFSYNFTKWNLSPKDILFVKPIAVRGTKEVELGWVAIGKKTKNVKEVVNRGMKQRFTEFDFFSKKITVALSAKDVVLDVKVPADPTMMKALYYAWSTNVCEDPENEEAGLVTDPEQIQYLVEWSNKGMLEDKRAWDLINFGVSSETAGAWVSLSLVEAPKAEFDKNVDNDGYIDTAEAEWLQENETERIANNKTPRYDNGVECK